MTFTLFFLNIFIVHGKGVNSVMTDDMDCANMSLGDAQKIYMNIEKRIILEKYTFPAKPSKDGYYRIYVSDTSKKTGRKQLVAKSLEELSDKVYAYEKGTNGHGRKTFKDVFEITLGEKLKYIKDPDKLLSRQNTVNRIRCDYTRYFSGTEFENRFIDAITKAEVEDIVFLNLDRYNLREKAFNALKSILRNVFSMALCKYWITDNVFEHIDFKKYEGMILENLDISKRVHSEYDLHRILDEIHKHQKRKPYYIPAYALELQILCGSRRGEIPPLRFQDIHETFIEFSREQISVKKFNDIPEYCKIVEHTKTNKNRFFPRYDALNEFLARFSVIHDKYYPNTDYLFPADTDNGVITNSTVYHFYSRVCKKLGIKICKEEIKGTHSFRRNAITDVVNASGGNLLIASSLFGNSPEVAKKNYYTGIDLDKATSILNTRKLS